MLAIWLIKYMRIYYLINIGLLDGDNQIVRGFQ
jgi:hypothetical protein